MRKTKKNSKFDVKKDSATGLYRIRALRDIGIAGAAFVEAGTYGGLISHKEVLSSEGGCWIEYGCTVIDSTIKDDAYIGGKSYVKNSTVDKKARVLERSTVIDSTITENAQIKNNATITNNCTIKGLSIVAGNSFLTHYVTVAGRAVIKDKARIVGGLTIDKDVVIVNDISMDLKERMLVKFGKPIDGYYKAYKIVKSTGHDKVFLSCYLSEFVYDLRVNKTIIEKNFNRRKKILCGEGLHLAMSEDYDWSSDFQKGADTILTCKVHVDDIVAIDEHMGSKIRAKKLTVVDIRKYPLDKELAQLKVTHNLNSISMITSVYNNKTFQVFRDYKVVPVDRKTALFKLNLDQNTDSIDNYNSVILSALPPNAPAVLPPKCYRELVIGNNVDDTFVVEHNLMSRNLHVIIYNLIGDSKEDVQERCTITYNTDKTIRIKFDHILKSHEEYKVLVVSPNRPVGIGTITARGIANATPFSSLSIFLGSDVSNDNSIVVTHGFGKFDVFGALHNQDTNESWPIHMNRIDENRVKITLLSKPNVNHQFILMITKV